MAPDITLFPIQQTMPSPLISVIVPIYNMESLLPRCLDSLAAQTLRDLEIICVDDGSTDGSGGIVRKYASGDSRFRLITQENSGRAEARNAGIRAAAAPYLGFADPDDYVEPDMYERLYRLAEESGADMVQCSYSPFLPAESGESRGMAEEKLREGVLGSNRTAYMNYIVPLLFPDNEMPAGRLRHWAELWREADITSKHVCGMPREQRAYLEAALAGRWIYLRLLQCFWKFKTARRKMFRLRFSKNGIDTLQILGYTLYSAKKLPRSSL